jgi:hypothetical protein
LTLMWMRSSPVDEPEEGNTGEDALVHRAQSDPEAFADLYQRHFADVYRWISTGGDTTALILQNPTYRFFFNVDGQWLFDCEAPVNQG